MRAGRRASPSRSPASLPSSQSPAAAFSGGRVPRAGAVPGCAAGSAVGVPREQKYPTTTTQALVAGTKATAPAPRMRLGHHTPRVHGVCTGKAAGWGGRATRGHSGDVLSGPQGSPKLAVPPQAGSMHPTAHPRTGQTVRSALQVTFQTSSISSAHQQAPGRVSPSRFPRRW